MTNNFKAQVLPFELVEQAGYARFNQCDHLCVDLPDGNQTITVRTSEGKKVTMAFLPYKTGGPAQCVDVAYASKGTSINNGGREVETFDTVVFTVGNQVFDSRCSRC